jgi:hypothetical protein
MTLMAESRSDDSIATAISHEADASEPEDHHRPSRGLGDGADVTIWLIMEIAASEAVITRWIAIISEHMR